MVEVSGASQIFFFFFLQFSPNIDGFRQNDWQGFYNNIYKLYKWNPLEKFSIFTNYQNYAVALIHMDDLI